MSDIGNSVRQRLLNQSRAQGRPFQEVLQYFAMERFLYRLANSPFADRFVLNGALLLTAWQAPLSRPTMDIDLAGRKTNIELQKIAGLIRSVCKINSAPDGSISILPLSRPLESQKAQRMRASGYDSAPSLQRRELRCKSTSALGMSSCQHQSNLRIRLSKIFQLQLSSRIPGKPSLPKNLKRSQHLAS